MSEWIALHGVAEAGKDTLGRVLVERYGFTRVAFADPVREMALAIDPIVTLDTHNIDDQCHPDRIIRLSHIVGERGWDDAKKYYPEVRRLLQRIGTDAVRAHSPDFWRDLAQIKAKQIGGKIVFTDTRFPNEGNMVRANGGIVAKLTTDSGIQDGNAGHQSETAMGDYTFDLVFDNPRTADSNELAQRMEHFAALLIDQVTD
jgi:hypothetical protein